MHVIDHGQCYQYLGVEEVRHSSSSSARTSSVVIGTPVRTTGKVGFRIYPDRDFRPSPQADADQLSDGLAERLGFVPGDRHGDLVKIVRKIDRGTHEGHSI